MNVSIERASDRVVCAAKAAVACCTCVHLLYTACCVG
jgi:hypothetical protein